ncbi:hypothetical protein Ancab_001237 [Ancistrocladus abbreviatus]
MEEKALFAERIIGSGLVTACLNLASDAVVWIPNLDGPSGPMLGLPRRALGRSNSGPTGVMRPHMLFLFKLYKCQNYFIKENEPSKVHPMMKQ